jgi:hypothetical protein
MKTLRFLLALSGASLLLAGYAFAEDKDDAKDKPKDQAACTCGKDKDGKACGTDKDCCCTGAKASKDAVKKDEPKQEEPKKP